MKSHGIWQDLPRKWGLKIGLVLIASVWLALVAFSWNDARADDSGDGQGVSGRSSSLGSSSGDNYNFNWLDPEKKIYVLQNRRYLKSNRVLLSVMAGTGMSSAYRTTYTVDGRLAYYFSEAFGIEFFYQDLFNTPNSTFQALVQAAPNTRPVVREIRGEYGALLHYVPWYAKINVFNSILYFDWYFSGGAGAVHSAIESTANTSGPDVYTPQDFMGIFVGTGHQYYLSDSFIVRLDLTGAYYRAPIYGSTGDSTWFSNYTFSVGLGLRL